MMYIIKNVLNAQQIAQCQRLLANADWVDGTVTAGSQAATVKNNHQLPESSIQSQQLRSIVLETLSKTPLFFTAALPKVIYPPYFNCYGGEKNFFGNHVDNAIRTEPSTAKQLRTDMSFTLFLNNPEDYEGGDLVMVDGAGDKRIKLPAGDLVLYPSYVVHRVEPVTSGKRLACFSWLESMVRDPIQRELLFNLDMNILSVREQLGDTETAVNLTNTYHNLMRMWAYVRH